MTAPAQCASRDPGANASEEHITLATAVFGAPASVDGHITPVDEHIARAPAVIAVPAPREEYIAPASVVF